MRIRTFSTEEEWMKARLCKIGGSRLKDIIVLRGDSYKIGFYELLAERLALPEEPENPMDRGKRLEEVAMERFMQDTGKKVNTDLIICERDDNPNIIVSPDGYIGETEMVEIKCLSSARHLETYLKQTIPSDYYMQVVQYFVVNEKLKNLYFVMYDPRIPAKDYFYLTITRDFVADDVEKYLEYEKMVLKEIDEIAVKLTF